MAGKSEVNRACDERFAALALARRAREKPRVIRAAEQTSDTALLVRPACFGFHAEAARSNAFASAATDGNVAALARREFDGLHRALADAGVDCLVLHDASEPAKPDAVFPNNWLSLHDDGTMVLYPMANAARRLERVPERIARLAEAAGREIRRTIDLSPLEQDGHFLEGTGSLILDRPANRAFAARSARTHDAAVATFDAATGYKTHLFDAEDAEGRSIYHTNVLMSLGLRFALLCVEAVAEADRAELVAAIETSGREIIAVDFLQMGAFACNAIELRNRSSEPLVALSSRALASLTPDQRHQLESLGGRLVDVPIPTIENVGGGSVRCMIAEAPLPRRG